MMKAIKILNIIVFCLVVFESLPLRAQDTDGLDDLDTILYGDKGDWWELEIFNRQNNSLGTMPPKESYFGKLDCSENVQFSLKITLKGTEENTSLKAHLYIGQDCDEDLLNCRLIGGSGKTVPSSNIVLYNNLELRNLFDIEASDCQLNNNISLRIWLALLEDTDIFNETQDKIERVNLSFTLKTSSPVNRIELEKTYVGDKNVELRWEKVNDVDIEGFMAAYTQVLQGNCADIDLNNLGTQDLSTKVVYKGGDAREIIIGGLENDNAYAFSLAALDAYGNPSSFSEAICLTPQESLGFGEGLETDGEYCFVATAVMGSYDHPLVKNLRRFRDEFLVRLPFGDKIIEKYYSFGPSLALLVEENQQQKKIWTSVVFLLSGFSSLLLLLGPVWTIIVFVFMVSLGSVLGFALPIRRER